ncbi:MAG: type II toxin-antitoxin system HipA family toxin [Bacteroidetes bacterium]|nr:type II toxin-antitoxin system HipA family toxin [Bacteroidota bacterium]
MANLTATVKLWGEFVGVVFWDEEKELGSFQYNPKFIKTNWEVAPLMMPLPKSVKKDNPVFKFERLNRETFYRLPGMLADALPDKYGTTLIDAWLASQGRTAQSMNPVERLCYMGNRGMGALEFEPATHKTKESAVSVEIKSLVEMAQQIIGSRKKFSVNLKNDVKKSLEDIIRVGTSAGGARAKAIIAYNEKTGEVRSGQVAAPKGFNHWLLKFDGVSDRALGDPAGYGRIELAYYYMALDCGIKISESRLLEENGRAHFMTKRFDRIKGKEKLHVQSLCGIRHFDFAQVGTYSYEQVFETIRSLRLPAGAKEQLYIRMVFNVIARNLDDHTKNFSFLMNKKGEWQLAPAYDLTYSYNPESKWVSQHNLSINGKTKDITKEDLLRVGHEMNVKKAKAIIEKVQSVIKKWAQYAKKTGVKADQIKAIDKTLLTKI